MRNRLVLADLETHQHLYEIHRIWSLRMMSNLLKIMQVQVCVPIKSILEILLQLLTLSATLPLSSTVQGPISWNNPFIELAPGPPPSSGIVKGAVAGSTFLASNIQKKID
jgi:hypothetical protein